MARESDHPALDFESKICYNSNVLLLLVVFCEYMEENIEKQEEITNDVG